MAGGLRGRLAAPKGGAGQGLAGQGLNFAAMLIPLVAGDVRQVTFAVVVSAAASIAARIAGLAFPAVYPVLPEEDAADSVAATVRVTLAAAAVAIVAGLMILPVSAHVASIVLWSTAMAVTMVLYQIVNAVFVRRSRYREYATVRLIYGAVNVVAVVAVTVMTDWTAALAATGVLAYAVGWLVGERRLSISLLRHTRHGDVRTSLRYIRTHREAILGQSIDIVGAQSPALSVASVGLATGNGIVWSGLQRIAGGVVTTFMMLIAPAMDMRVAETVRGGDRGAVRGRVLQVTAVAAILAAAAAVATVLAAIVILRWNRDFTVGWWLMALVVAFCAAQFLLSIVNKYLIMIGSQRLAAVWSTFRTISAVTLLALFEGDALIAAICIQSSVFVILYLLLLLAALRTDAPVAHPDERTR